MRVLDYLDATLIELHLPGRSKEQVLTALVGLLAEHGRIQGREALLAALLEREGLGSTGIGHGVAIPHARTAELTRPAIAFARSEHAVDYDAIDGQPARIFFLLVAPENGGNEHLLLLSRIARLMRDTSVRERLLTLDDKAQVLDLFGEREPA
jgi:PTS system fructose-specific IIC component